MRLALPNTARRNLSVTEAGKIGVGRRGPIGSRRLNRLAIAMALAVSWACPAAAQTALDDSIRKRPRPEYDPIGIVVGPADSFLLFPKFELGTEFTDNLFSAENGEAADFATIFKPSFEIRSDWVNHGLQISGKVEHTRYYDNNDENSLDYGLAVQGRLDALANSELTASLSFDEKHQDRGDPDDDVGGVFESEQTIFRVTTLKLGGKYNEDAILLKLDVKVDRSDFDDAGATNNDDRDRVEVETRARIGYEWVPGSTAFIEVAVDIREFDDEVDDNNFKRSSRGYEVLLGNTLDLSGVTFAELGVGFVRQNFSDQLAGTPNLGPTQGVSFKGSLVWNPTDLLTVTGKLRREVRETTIAGASSAFTSTFELGVDYGMLENLIFGAKSKFSIESFDGIDQEDKVIEFELDAEYLIGPNVVVKAEYRFEDRIADTPGGSFVVNTFMLSLVARL